MISEIESSKIVKNESKEESSPTAENIIFKNELEQSSQQIKTLENKITSLNASYTK